MIPIGKPQQQQQMSAKQRKLLKKREKRERRNAARLEERKESAEREQEILRMISSSSREKIKSTIKKVTRKTIGTRSGIVIKTGDRFSIIKTSLDDSSNTFTIKINPDNIPEEYKPEVGDKININIVEATFGNGNIQYEIARDEKIILVLTKEDAIKERRKSSINRFLNNYEDVVICTEKCEETTKGGASLTIFKFNKTIGHKFKTLITNGTEISVLSRFVKKPFSIKDYQDEPKDIAKDETKDETEDEPKDEPEYISLDILDDEINEKIIDNKYFIIRLGSKKGTTRGLKAMYISEEEKNDIIADYKNSRRKESIKIEKMNSKSINTKRTKKRTTSGYAAAFSDDSDSDDE